MCIRDRNTGNVIYAYPGFNPNVPSFNEYPYDPSYWWDDDDEDEWDDEDWWYYHEGPGAVYGQGWRYSPGGWWFQLYGGGWLSDGWKMIRNRWYRFDGNGYMVTGWFTDADGNRYYLNPVDDGTLGMIDVYKRQVFQSFSPSFLTPDSITTMLKTCLLYTSRCV